MATPWQPGGQPGDPPYGGPRRTEQATDLRPFITVVSPNSDRLVGGAAITITGSNFITDGAGTPLGVTIGGVAATDVVVVSATQITCVAPAHATGVVDVTVTNFHGQSDTLASSFVYVSPIITDITPNYGVLSGGTSIVIEGGNFVPGSSITFGGVAATDVTFIDEQHYSCVTPAHAVGPVTVKVDALAFSDPFFFTLLTRGQDIRRMPGINIEERMGNAPNTCAFTVDGQSSPPQAGSMIEVLDEMDADRQLFRGVVQSVDQIYEDQITQLMWSVRCADFTFWLNRRHPFGQYSNVSVTAIVLDLVAKYATWVDTSFVQTSLCNVNVAFDGSETFGECLSILARLLGGGHWYLDYQKRLHFFRVTGLKGSITTTPESPSTTINPKTGQVGSGAAMTLAVGGVFPDNSSAPNSWVALYSTFVYDNGLESMLSKVSNIVQTDGTHFLTATNIPTGAPAGALTCVKRKIYAQVYGYLSDMRHVLTIENNTATSANLTWFATSAQMVSLLNPGVPNLIGGSGLVANKAVATPPNTGVVAPTIAMSDTTITNLMRSLGFNSITWLIAPAYMQAKVTGVYQDGTESQASPASLTLFVDGQHAIRVTPPIFPDINGVSCAYVKVYLALSFGSDPDWSTRSGGIGGIIPGNVGQATDIWMNYLLGSGSYSPPTISAVSELDPCDGDGPYLEDSLTQPSIIDDDNLDLLRDPALVSQIDVSQIRNRVFVRGGGTITTADAAVGATVISVADISALPPGGDVIIGSAGLHVQMIGANGIVGAASITLSAPLTQPVPSGSGVRGLAVLSDRDAQRLMGRIALDDNGNPTDGIHEYFIDDSSLVSFAQQVNRATAELELFSRPVMKVRYATRDPQTHPGRKVTFNLTDPPVKGDFLIQSVTVDQIHDESDQLMPRYTAEASSVRFELDDLLLMIAKGAGGGSGSSSWIGSPGNADLAGISTAGIKETAVTESVAQAKSYTDTAVAAIGSPAITSVAGPVQLFGVYKTIDFTLARQMSTSPIELAPAVPGKVLIPMFATFEQNITGSPYSANWNNTLVHEGLIVSLLGLISTSNGGGPRTFWGPFPGVPGGTQDGINVSAANRGLFLRGSVDVTSGSGNIRVGVVYAQIDALT